MKIVTTAQRGGGYVARVEGDPGCWGFGETVAEAIGDLVVKNMERFGIASVDGAYI